MLPEQTKRTGAEGEMQKVEVTPTFLGGDSAIEPVMGRDGKVESYKVLLFRGENVPPVILPLSKEKGDDLIQARLSKMASELAKEGLISDEAFASLVPSYVANEYKKRLIEIGTPIEEIPDTVTKMFEKMKRDLVDYREMGKEQIANSAQQIADELMEITKEVLKGNNLRYNNLPDDFKESVKFLRPTFAALAIQNAGVTKETMEAQRMALAINVMGQESFRNLWLDHLKTTASASGDAISGFFGSLFGSLIGTSRGAAEVAYEKTKEVLAKKR